MVASAVKVYKKTTANGKLTVYLGKRDFVDHIDYCDPVDGVIVIDNEYLQGRNVYGQLIVTYRYGREEDEVMGVKFSKELNLAREQIFPLTSKSMEMTPIQEKLVKKLGPTAHPFTFVFPPNSPSSVTLQMADAEEGKPLGVSYTIQCYVASNIDDVSNRNMVTLAVKKLQYAPASRGKRLPSSLVSKGFTFSNGKINLEVTLDREIYYHGEKVSATVVVTNNSKKTVKNIKCYVMQHTEVTMINSQFSKQVASLETREGCPITPGANFTKAFFLVPVAASNKEKRGIALDGSLKDEDVNLASSTMVAEGKAVEAMGIVVSYSVRVELNCGTLGGSLATDVPLKLLNPAPGTVDKQRVNALKKMESIEGHRAKDGARYGNDDENIVFEDFAHMRMRMNEPE